MCVHIYICISGFYGAFDTWKALDTNDDAIEPPKFPQHL